MLAIAGSLYLLGTVAFGLAAIVIGIRLVLLSRRTGQRPERDLGLGLMLTGGFGYMTMILSMVARQGFVAEGADVPFLLDALIYAGWVSHNVGFTFMLLFIATVFRPDAAWARALVVGASVVLWIGWGLYCWQGGVSTGRPTMGYWIAFSVIGSYPIWGSAESFRYWRLMKRREGLGLAEPLVTNRFLLWFMASMSGLGSIWIASVPAILGETGQATDAGSIVTACLLATAACGLATVCLYWLTFFPPQWYRRVLLGPATA